MPMSLFQNMVLFQSVTLLWAVSSVIAEQNQYTVLFKKVDVEYVDNNYLDLHAEIYPLNKTTNAFNLTLTLKLVLPEDTKVNIRAMKERKGAYMYNPIVAEKLLKNALEMQGFGIQTVCQERMRPPAVWPLKKNVAYRLSGWVPDSSTYPPNIPEGKWKLQETITLPNKTTIMIASWYSEVQYKKTAM